MSHQSAEVHFPAPFGPPTIQFIGTRGPEKLNPHRSGSLTRASVGHLGLLNDALWAILLADVDGSVMSEVLARSQTVIPHDAVFNFRKVHPHGLTRFIVIPSFRYG